jgi:anthranilate synthase component 1
MIQPDFQAYEKAARSFTVIPVFEEIGADFETPLSLFLKGRGLFLLESIERGENVGRYSIIACGSKSVITLRGREVVIRENNGGGRTVVQTAGDNPLLEVRNYLSRLRAPAVEGVPPFFGGAIGYLGYEAVRYFEDVPVHTGPDDIPDGIFIVPEMLLVYDSVKRSVFLAAMTYPAAGVRAEYDQAVQAIEQRLRSLQEPLRPPVSSPSPGRLALQSDMDQSVFLRGVETCQRHIRQGDIIQAVLSQRFTAETDVAPFSIYQTLRMINPSPYLFYLDFGEFLLIGSSPEVMVRIQNKELLTKPIAGTRPRGATVSEDNRLARDLLSDPKERAEHIMLVDLARNDLGRVAAPGSVEVTDFMSVEKYSHVMHLVSTVKAELDARADVFDVIRAVFPAGTLTGAPKIRAMEIIHEIEGSRRGPYGGMVFYLGFNGNFDSCITIRTVVVKGRRAIIQAGAGVVADSRPDGEYQETVNKARALFQAVERASTGRKI